MQKRYLLIMMALAVHGLHGCGGASSSSNPSPIKEEEKTLTLDPFLKHQWYLHNTGQSALTASGQGGQPEADINAFSSASLTAESYAKGHSGKGVEIAILDSGLDIDHEDLVENVIKDGSYNFAHASNGKGKFDPTPTETGGDHGTSVAGLAAARGGNGKGLWGVAPQASLRGFNFMASSDEFVAEIASLGYADAVSQFNGMQNSTVAIYNKSYGGNPITTSDKEETTLGQLTLNAVEVMKWGTENLRGGKGAIYVKSAGNEFESIQDSPANCADANFAEVTCYNTNQEPENNSPYQIIVGAYNAEGKRASYSSTGASVWMVSPGGEFGQNSPALMTTDLSGCAGGYSRTEGEISPDTDFNRGKQDSGNESCHYYSAFNGTSSAAPVASGAIALMLEANPNLSWRDVKHILAKTARQIEDDLEAVTHNLNGNALTIEQGWVENAAGYPFSNAYGFGAFDVQAAVQMAMDWKSQNKTLPAMTMTQQPEQSLSSENAIPSNATGLVKTTNVSQTGKVETVVIELDIMATQTVGNTPQIDGSDYLVEITSPSGTKSIALTPFNAYYPGHNLDGMLVSSNAFYGEPLNGNWTLRIIDVDDSNEDNVGQGKGQLTEFQWTFFGHQE